MFAWRDLCKQQLGVGDDLSAMHAGWSVDILSSTISHVVTHSCGFAGMALGMVMQLPDQDDETSVSRRQLLAKLDVCMGGRVAEELIFGESNITTGNILYFHG